MYNLHIIMRRFIFDTLNDKNIGLFSMTSKMNQKLVMDYVSPKLGNLLIAWKNQKQYHIIKKYKHYKKIKNIEFGDIFLCAKCKNIHPRGSIKCITCKTKICQDCVSKMVKTICKEPVCNRCVYKKCGSCKKVSCGKPKCRKCGITETKCGEIRCTKCTKLCKMCKMPICEKTEYDGTKCDIC